MTAVVTLVAMTASSLASETATVARSLPCSAYPAALTAPTVLAKKVALNPTELAHYRLLAQQSQVLATSQTAGASSTTKTVLIVVGVVVVVVGVAALAASNINPLGNGPIFPPGTTI